MAKPERLRSEREPLLAQRSQSTSSNPVLFYGAYTCFLLAVISPVFLYAYALYRTYWASAGLLVFLYEATWMTRAVFTVSFLSLLCKGSPLAVAIMLLMDENFRLAALPAIGWYIILSIILAFYLGLFVVGVYGLQVLKGTYQENGEHPYLVRKLIPLLPWLWNAFTLTLLPPWGRFTLEEFCGDNEKCWYSTSVHPIWAARRCRGAAKDDDISFYGEQRKPVFSPTPKVNGCFSQRY
ncbi:hypothetical protein F4776DRAFT_603848 [Hypoxylon sp. NC0597]|nr:hypothetical protein F4776DRAFT_603848 [Hypoxylon sp. NC0597]